MTDYKDTLNLPKTAFPMKANLAQREPKILQQWQTTKLYQKLRQQRQHAQSFILHDGPPYANGDIHIGHAVNKILKDTIVKSQSLNGYNCPYVPGWDCHGLPIELNVEKKLTKAGKTISAKAFRQACREYATTQVDRQRDSFIRLGVLGDWSNPYLTLNPHYEANTIRALAKIIGQGHLQQGFKPVHWCVECGSALAEAEVEYRDKKSSAIDVAFELKDSEQLWSRCQLHADIDRTWPVEIAIWTTTPWTLPANQAVAVHPDAAYQIIACEQQGQTTFYLIIAEALMSAALDRYRINTYHTVAHCHGRTLEHLMLQHPFYQRSVPIVLGKHVTMDAGTGAVHTAPAHGVDDYQIGQQYNLDLHGPVNNKGCFNEDTELFAGMHVFKANAAIIQHLAEHKRLLHESQLEHSYPHCWRHKSPLIFRATPQWFVSMEKANLREQVLTQISKVQWLPEWGEARIKVMVEQRPDWCISRQRLWGVPLCVFVHKESGQLHPRTLEIMEQVAQQVEQYGVDAWFECDATQYLGEEASHYEKIVDTLDVWFDSGVSHHCVLGAREELHKPADIYLEGSDQHRGWFQTSLLTAVAMYGEAPYRHVLTHGYTVDAQGRKMSKSLGNVIAPDKVINNLGADVLRLWAASSAYSNEINVSDEILRRTSDTYRRLRNTARFLLSNLHDFDPLHDQLVTADLLPLDAWAIDRALITQQKIREGYDSYQFHLVTQSIHHFCNVDMGAFYLDVIKDRLYTAASNSKARRSAQTALYHIAEALVRWLAPIVSFTSEEIWQHMPGERNESVFLNEWYQGLTPLSDKAAVNREHWSTLIAVRNAVNKELEVKRAADEIGSGLDAKVTLFAEGELLSILQNLGEELRFVLITSEAQVQPLAEQNDNAIETDIANLKITVQGVSYAKCVRCWQRRSDVGVQVEHPDICYRCYINISTAGEERQYA